MTTMPTTNWCSWNSFKFNIDFSTKWFNSIPPAPRLSPEEQDLKLHFHCRPILPPPPAGLSTWTPHWKEIFVRREKYLIFSTHHSAIFLWALSTLFSMSMGWYLMPRRIRVSSRAPTTNTASWYSAISTWRSVELATRVAEDFAKISLSRRRPLLLGSNVEAMFDDDNIERIRPSRHFPDYYCDYK